MYPTYDYSTTTNTGSGFFTLTFLLCTCIILLPILVFWIWMVVDAAKREYSTKELKLPWLLAVIFGGIIPALVYYFKIKKTDNQITKTAVVESVPVTEESKGE